MPQAETWLIIRKHRHKLLATEMDYLRRSVRISRMDRIKNETIRTKMGMKKDILQEIEEQQLRRYGNVMRMEGRRIARQVAGDKEARQTSQHMERWNLGQHAEKKCQG
jgi:hypothetical protein